MNEEQLRVILEDFMEELQEILLQLKEEETTEVIANPERLSPRLLGELISHEGIVLEAYKDSKGIWTWGIGVTDASGHSVGRYKDNPQTLTKVFDIFDWLVRTRYLPAVKKAFTRPLTEEQLAAALSFHYNTGAIGRASWVKSFNKGDTAKARREIMNWVTPKEITARRKKEQELFFDGKWSGDGTALVYQGVRRPSYVPTKPQRINIEKELKQWAS